jgi:hypothetical protein
MTFDIAKIVQSKREFRRRLAALPIEEKLAMLDALRERMMIIRSARSVANEDALHEKTTPYYVGGENSE